MSGSRAWDVATARVPEPVRAWAGPTLRAVSATVLGFLACSAALVAVAFVTDLGNAASIISRLGLRGGDPLMLVLLSAVVAPNAVLMGGAYLLGPGFAVGVGTTVSPSLVALGPVPAFPLLAALPDDGPTPWFAAASMVVPALAAFVGVALVQRRSPVLAWDAAALRGIGSGVLAGVATGLLGGLAGGALGSGRMADLGPSVTALVVAATMAMGVGGLLGALVTTAFQRRAARDGFDPRYAPTETYDVAALRGEPEPEAPEAEVSSDEEVGLRELRARFVAQTGRATPPTDADPDAEDTVVLD